ncbi:helix-turn-helix domain-containing protein [Weissella tructae]
MNRLKEVRQSNNLTQKDVSEGTDIPVNTYSNYERGDREPKLEVWGKLASFFGLDVPYLQGLTDEPAFTQETLQNALYKLDSSKDEQEYKQSWEEFDELSNKEEAQKDLFRGLSIHNNVFDHTIGKLSWRVELTPERVEKLTSLGRSADYMSRFFEKDNSDFFKEFEELTKIIFNDHDPIMDEYAKNVLHEASLKIQVHGEQIKEERVKAHKEEKNKQLLPKKQFDSLYARLHD